jgi:hypothetical protein
MEHGKALEKGMLLDKLASLPQSLSWINSLVIGREV